MLTSLLDGRLMAERHGRGTPQVIALHGWARNRHDWGRVLAGHDALALDLPGFGASPPPDAVWGSEDYARMLLPLLDESAPVVLLGHSFGGRIAVEAARLAPAGVRGLVLTGVPLLRAELPTSGSKPALEYRVVKALRARGLVPESVLETYREKHGSADYRAARGVMRGVFVRVVNEDYGDTLAALAASGIPADLVWGEGDTAAPVGMARSAQRLLGPTASLDVVAGSAHLLDEPLTEHLRAALGRLLGQSTAEKAAEGNR